MKKTLSFLFVGLIAGCSALPLPEADISNPAQLLFNGYVHADVDCYCCHTGDGSGTWKGEDLTGVGQRLSRDEIISVIQSGPSIMPAYKDKLTGAELAQLADWLESLN